MPGFLNDTNHLALQQERDFVMATQESNRAKDQSGNRKYFTMLLRIVQMKARSPYDISAWTTVMDVAGESGECDYLTEELAALAMMSVGKFSECRAFLLEQRLLEGYLENDDGRGNKRWHLTVPDLWAENVKISQQFKTVRNRIKFKKEQLLSNKKTVSCGEKETFSPHEKGLSSHEKAVSPGETPSFIEKNLLEEPEKNQPPAFAQKLPLKKYSAEWAMWTVEQGDELFERAFGEKRVWDTADLQGFANLRDAGKMIDEITARFKIYLAEKNSWYAAKGYSFAEFAKNYNTFSPTMAARKAGKNGASAKNGNAGYGEDQAAAAMKALGIEQ